MPQQPREAEELRWEQEFAPPQLASPHARKVIPPPCAADGAPLAVMILSCYYMGARDIGD